MKAIRTFTTCLTVLFVATSASAGGGGGGQQCYNVLDCQDGQACLAVTFEGGELSQVGTCVNKCFDDIDCNPTLDELRAPCLAACDDSCVHHCERMHESTKTCLPHCVEGCDQRCNEQALAEYAATYDAQNGGAAVFAGQTPKFIPCNAYGLCGDEQPPPPTNTLIADAAPAVDPTDADSPEDAAPSCAASPGSSTNGLVLLALCLLWTAGRRRRHAHATRSSGSLVLLVAATLTSQTGCAAADGEALDVTDTRPGPCNYSYDYDLDGQADRTAEYLYDGDGHLLSIAVDAEADGTIDGRTTHTVAADGTITNTVEDKIVQGWVVHRRSTTFDSRGEWTLREVDSDGDGVNDDRRLRSFDASGRLLLEARDPEGDGQLDVCAVYGHDVDSDQVQIPPACVGKNAIVIQKHDALGRLIEQTKIDQPEDDLPETTFFFYDDHDRLVETKRYFGSRLHSSESFIYDRFGRLIEQRSPALFSSGDVCYSNRYDQAGELRWTSEDIDCDGVLEQCETFSMDRRGQRTRAERDFDCDGEVDTLTTWDYGCWE